jgi:hypothetical protein
MSDELIEKVKAAGAIRLNRFEPNPLIFAAGELSAFELITQLRDTRRVAPLCGESRIQSFLGDETLAHQLLVALQLHGRQLRGSDGLCQLRAHYVDFHRTLTLLQIGELRLGGTQSFLGFAPRSRLVLLL